MTIQTTARTVRSCKVLVSQSLQDLTAVRPRLARLLSSSVGDTSAESGVVADASFTATCAFIAGVCDNRCERIASGDRSWRVLWKETCVDLLSSCDPLFFPNSYNASEHAPRMGIAVSFVCRGVYVCQLWIEATKFIIISIFAMRAADLGCANVQTKSCSETETSIFVSNF